MRLMASHGRRGARIHYDNEDSHPLSFNIRWDEYDPEQCEKAESLVALLIASPQLRDALQTAWDHIESVRETYGEKVPGLLGCERDQILKALNAAKPRSQRS
jgi:hypothetical protein